MFSDKDISTEVFRFYVTGMRQISFHISLYYPKNKLFNHKHSKYLIKIRKKFYWFNFITAKNEFQNIDLFLFVALWALIKTKLNSNRHFNEPWTPQCPPWVSPSIFFQQQNINWNKWYGNWHPVFCAFLSNYIRTFPMNL